MSKKARLSHDQKRKQKLAKRSRREPQQQSLAYSGNRYKSADYVEPLFQAEKGIFQVYVISDRQITDDDVEEGLEGLIESLRARPAAELIYEIEPAEGQPREASISSLILSEWGGLLDDRKLPARDDLIGILRTILGSIETWRSKSASSRGYLNYLEGFMLKLGYQVRVQDAEGRPMPEPPPDELYEAGQMWLSGSPEARNRFTVLANELLAQGKTQPVVNVCQKLLGEIDSTSRPEFPILSELSIRAQKAQRNIAGPATAPGLKGFMSRLMGR